MKKILACFSALFFVAMVTFSYIACFAPRPESGDYASASIASSFFFSVCLFLKGWVAE